MAKKLVKKDGKYLKRNGKFVVSEGSCDCCEPPDFCTNVAGVQIIGGKPGWSYDPGRPCEPCYSDCVPKDAPSWQFFEEECNAHRQSECAPVPCYNISGESPGGPSCCDAGGCCNYSSSRISERLAKRGDSWVANSAGPAGTSDWTLSRNGTRWTLENNCQQSCHTGLFVGSVDGWDGQGCKEFPMQNGYPTIKVCAGKGCPIDWTGTGWYAVCMANESYTIPNTIQYTRQIERYFDAPPTLPLSLGGDGDWIVGLLAGPYGSLNEANQWINANGGFGGECAQKGSQIRPTRIAPAAAGYEENPFP